MCVLARRVERGCLEFYVWPCLVFDHDNCRSPLKTWQILPVKRGTDLNHYFRRSPLNYSSVRIIPKSCSSLTSAWLMRKRARLCETPYAVKTHEHCPMCQSVGEGGRGNVFPWKMNGHCRLYRSPTRIAWREITLLVQVCDSIQRRIRHTAAQKSPVKLATIEWKFSSGPWGCKRQ